MKLQRYKLVGCDKVADRCRAYMLGSGEGKYVDHSEALDWFESLLDRPIPDHYDWSEREIVTIERVRLRALIAAQRGEGV